MQSIMADFVNFAEFENYQKYIDNKQEVQEQIKLVIRKIEQLVKKACIQLQIIHFDLTKIKFACEEARKVVLLCSNHYKELAELIPINQYYRYNDRWTFVTQRLVFVIAMVVYLETGALVTRESVAAMLALKTYQLEGFHLDIEDYLFGILQMASELSRFATNSVTMGDYERPLCISHFMAEVNAGFRMLNLKNDGLRKRFDALKYDVKKIEEVVYDISIRGLRNGNGRLNKNPENVNEDGDTENSDNIGCI